MKRKTEIVAFCQECGRKFNKGWIHPNAKKHAKATGHKVLVINTLIYNSD